MHSHASEEAPEWVRPKSPQTELVRRPQASPVAGLAEPADSRTLLGLQRAAGNAAVAGLLEERSPVHEVVSSSGRPLEPEVRADMESRLGADFSDVRVHDDSAAAASASAVNAHAYTVGTNVVFQRDAYDPSSHAGQVTLAHELTHVVQQRNGPVAATSAPGGIAVSDPSDRFELEASANAERVMSAPSTPRAVDRAVGGPEMTGGVPAVQRLGKKAEQRVKRWGGAEAVTEAEKWQKKGGLSDPDADAVVNLGQEDFERALQFDPASFSGAGTSSDVREMLERASARSKSKEMGDKASSSAGSGPKRSPALVALSDRGIADAPGRQFILLVGAGAVNAWLAVTPDDTIVLRTVNACNKDSKTLAQIAQVLVTDNPNGYPAADLLDLLVSYGYDSVRPLLLATNVENSLLHLQLCLGYGVTAASSVQLRRLVRFQARLRTTPALRLTVYQADRNYVTSLDPPSRTGFLRYDFGGDVMEVHTHWNQTGKRLVSMHIQDNAANGTEINTWTWFADVAAAVRDSHNAGAFRPTTDPVGGTLTL